jgi:hypothetical protein
LQYGAQVEYFHRATWPGQGGVATGNDVVGMTGIRFYLP